MSDMIERVGLLLRAAEEQRRQLDEIETQENAELSAQLVSSKRWGQGFYPTI